MNFVNRVLVVFLVFVIPLVGIGQVKDDFLPKTIIFKVKEEYRQYCGENKIADSDFNLIAGQIELAKLQKIFPQKEKETNKEHLIITYKD